jgi:16S rRNA (cytosine967-C5)-methyltransferase
VKPPTARQVAALVLGRVDKDAAFAAAALDAELGRAVQLDARDRAFATELVYGTLRVQPWLDAEIARCAPRGIGGLDAETRFQLELAAYQLFFLSRVPAFAAVNEAVEHVRIKRGVKVSRFANAVLRKLAGRAEHMSEDELARLPAQAGWESTPEWLKSALSRAVGEEGARSFLSPLARDGSVPVGIRVERAEEREGWLHKLREAAPAASFEPGRVSPLAILARGAGRPRALPGYDEGAWSIQEEGSQVVALAVGARPRDRVLDACAGRGNKSAVLARAVAPEGALDAADSHPAKLDRLVDELARLGLAPRSTLAVDWSVGSGACHTLYDRALVDAPCSGTGTLRHRPEILLRRSADDLAVLASTQRAILRQVSEYVVPRGRLVYAVCSVLREEAEEVVDVVLKETPTLELAPFDAPPADALAGPGVSSLRLLPDVHGTDGYFLACLRKKE